MQEMEKKTDGEQVLVFYATISNFGTSCDKIREEFVEK